MTLSPEILKRLWAHWPVGRLATVSADGQPHCVPVVFCEHEGLIYIPVDGKRKRHARLKRLANVAAMPASALLLDHYSDDWLELWWVRIDASAERLEAPANGDAVAARFLEKYPQYMEMPLSPPGEVYLCLQPQRVSAWSQAGSGAPIVAALDELAASPG
jgi:PPOX class probable F420-dependent enzyme